MSIQSMLNKYTPVSMNSVKIEKNLYEIDKEAIFEKDSQLPNLVISSSRPFDKNNCFYDLPLKNSIKENIFPKVNYTLKENQKIKELDIDSIFDEKNSILKNDPDKESLKNKKLEIIKSGKYKEYIPKINMNLTLEQVYSREKNNKWYIIKEDENLGPFNDFNLYKKIKDIYTQCIIEQKKIPSYLIKKETDEIYLTMEECFEKLNQKFSKIIQKNIMDSNILFIPIKNPSSSFSQSHSANNNINNNTNETKETSNEKNKEVKNVEVEDFFN